MPTSEMNPVYDPMQRRMVSGPEAGQNTTVDGFQVNVIGGGTGSEGLYNAGDGLDLTGSTFSVNLTAGFRTEINGSTIAQARYVNVETVSGSSVIMQAGHAYKVYATSQAVTLNTEMIQPNTYGLEAHLEIFVASTGYVVAGSNVVLTSALEPDAVNNCTVRFHDGLAIISVEDHIGGYIVVSATGTTAGTLPYALTSATQKYVAFDATLNGAVIDLSDSTASGEKHIVGNGYAETTLTGAVDCGTSKFTVANLSLSDVQVIGGTMTLGDAFIPSGSTVSVSGGGLAVKKVTGAGSDSVIDLGGTNVVVSGGNAVVRNATITGGTAGNDINGGAFVFNYAAHAELTSSIISGNSCAISNGGNGGGFFALRSAVVILTGTTVTENRTVTGIGGGIALQSASILSATLSVISGNYAGNASAANDLYVNSATAKLLDGNTVGTCFLTGNGLVELSGSNTVKRIVSATSTTSGTVTISSGAIIDLTGNTNATPIAPGGGITFELGGATVLYGESAGVPTSSAVIAGTSSQRLVSTIGNAGQVTLIDPYYPGNEVQFSFTNMTVKNNVTMSANGNSKWTFINCVYPGCILLAPADTVSIVGGTITGTISLRGGANCELSGYVDFATEGYVRRFSGSSYVTLADNTELDFTSATTPAPVVGTTVSFGANVSVIPYGGGDAVLLNGGSAGTCKKINNDGTTE